MVLQLNQAALHGHAHPRKGSSSFYILCNGRNSKVVYNAEQQFDEDGKLSLSFEKLCLVLITTIQTCYE